MDNPHAPVHATSQQPSTGAGPEKDHRDSNSSGQPKYKEAEETQHQSGAQTHYEEDLAHTSRSTNSASSKKGHVVASTKSYQPQKSEGEIVSAKHQTNLPEKESRDPSAKRTMPQKPPSKQLYEERTVTNDAHESEGAPTEVDEASGKQHDLSSQFTPRSMHSNQSEMKVPERSNRSEEPELHSATEDRKLSMAELSNDGTSNRSDDKAEHHSAELNVRHRHRELEAKLTALTAELHAVREARTSAERRVGALQASVDAQTTALAARDNELRTAAHSRLELAAEAASLRARNVRAEEELVRVRQVVQQQEQQKHQLELQSRMLVVEKQQRNREQDRKIPDEEERGKALARDDGDKPSHVNLDSGAKKGSAMNANVTLAQQAESTTALLPVTSSGTRASPPMAQSEQGNRHERSAGFRSAAGAVLDVARPLLWLALGAIIARIR